VNSKEELRRLFQLTAQFHADELPTKAGIDKLDKLHFHDFLRDIYKVEYPESTEDFSGPLRKVFDDTLAFVMRNLHKIQAGRGVNAPGLQEIPEAPAK